MKNKKVCYIVYKFDEFTNDFEYIKEYYNTKELANDYKLKNVKSVYHYIVQTIEDKKQLLNNKYLIVKDYL